MTVGSGGVGATVLGTVAGVGLAVGPTSPAARAVLAATGIGAVAYLLIGLVLIITGAIMSRIGARATGKS